MTEEDYVNVANLTRITDALAILRDVVPDAVVKRSVLAEASKRLANIEAELREVIKLD